MSRDLDDYLRSLAESIGVDMDSFDLPAAHGNDALRRAVLIQDRIGELQDAEKKLAEMKTKQSKGGKVGGAARAAALTPERRKAIASAAAKARWSTRQTSEPQ